MIITIEGVDSVGKHTQADMLVEWMAKNKRTCYYYSFPRYETRIGKLIDDFLHGRLSIPMKARHLLLAANRREFEPDIVEQTKKGFVVMDRYYEANLAFGVAEGSDLSWLLGLEKGLPKSDVVIVLVNDPAHLVNRKTEKDDNEKNLSLQQRVAEEYVRLASELNWHVVDAQGTPQEVHERVMDVLTPFLKEGA